MKKNIIVISLAILLVVLAGLTAYFFMNDSAGTVSESSKRIQDTQSTVSDSSAQIQGTRSTTADSSAGLHDAQNTLTALEGLTYIEDPMDYDGTKPIIKKMKETFSIAGTEYRDQRAGPRDPSELLVAWGGELEFTINDARWFSSVYQSGIDKNELASFNPKNAERPFVIVDVTMKFEGESDSPFSTDIFKLSAKEDYQLNHFLQSEYEGLQSYLEYFSLHGEDNYYYVFYVSVNQPLTFKLGFSVPQGTNKDELFLNLGGTNNLNLIGVQLDFSE